MADQRKAVQGIVWRLTCDITTVDFSLIPGQVLVALQYNTTTLFIRQPIHLDDSFYFGEYIIAWFPAADIYTICDA